MERDRAEMERMDAEVRAATRGTPAEEVERAQKLLDMGAIDYAEFEELKQRALA
jgi:hypothetical protein